jgi:hypothetical protein
MSLKEDFLHSDVRRTRIRLTRAALLALAVLVFLGAALLLTAGHEVVTGESPAAMATPEPDTAPAAGPVTPALPAGAAASATCPPDPADWSVRLAPGPGGQSIGHVEPPCAAGLVLADWQEAITWYYETPERDPAGAYQYFSDDPLASLAGLMSSTVTSLQSIGQSFRVVASPQDQLTYLSSFGAVQGQAGDAGNGRSPAGLQATVVDRLPGGSVFQILERESGAVVREERHPAHLMVFTLTYDPRGGRWKIDAMAEQPLEPAGDPELYREVIRELLGDEAILDLEGMP